MLKTLFCFISLQFANLAGNDDQGKWRGQVFGIWDLETGRKLLETTAGMYISIFVFGYPVAKTSFSGYILNDNGDYSIYKPRQWNHLCMSWSSGGPTKIVLVRYIKNNWLKNDTLHFFKTIHTQIGLNRVKYHNF